MGFSLSLLVSGAKLGSQRSFSSRRCASRHPVGSCRSLMNMAARKLPPTYGGVSLRAKRPRKLVLIFDSRLGNSIVNPGYLIGVNTSCSVVNSSWCGMIKLASARPPVRTAGWLHHQMTLTAEARAWFTVRTLISVESNGARVGAWAAMARAHVCWPLARGLRPICSPAQRRVENARHSPAT